MSTNRGMIKWAPFNAVESGNIMVQDVLSKKNILKMPTLSDDQIEVLEHKLIEAHNNGSIVNILYFKEGKYYKKQGIIANIDVNKAKIVLKDGFFVFFSQIIEIS